MDNKKILDLSDTFEELQEITKSGSFLNCFDRVAILLFIYKNSNPPDERVRFSDLASYIKQSEVYLAKVLKEGVETDHIKIYKCPEDRRRKSYELTTRSLKIFQSLSY